VPAAVAKLMAADVANARVAVTRTPAGLDGRRGHEIAQHIEDNRLPGPDELRVLLERYFEGPITDEIALRLHSEMVAIFKNVPRMKGDISAFFRGNRVGQGEAWREEFSGWRSTPRNVDLALFHAATRRGYPKPKLHCPTFFLGTWRQTNATASTGEPIHWRFAANGDFHTNHPSYFERTEWCHHGSPEEPGQLRYTSVCVQSARFRWRPIAILNVSDHGLELGELRYDGHHDYCLERCRDEPEG